MSTGVSQLVATARSMDSPARVRALARLMSKVENERGALDELRRIDDLHQSRPQHVVGITGPPGAGKSTLVDALIGHVRGALPDWRVGVIAVDPSSPFTGGAVLGDRVRLMRHATDGQVWIRSLASRGHLGGLAAGVEGVLAVMAVAGCQIVFVETVGVGQSEIEVARIADRTCIVLAPGLGDGVQLLKAGLMEIGDVFVVNKSDREGAERLGRQLRCAVQRRTQLRHGADLMARCEPPRVLLASAANGLGIDHVWNALTGVNREVVA